MEVSHVTQYRIRRRFCVIPVLSTAASVVAASFGTAEEAEAMLEGVAAVKEDKAKAWILFNNGKELQGPARSMCGAQHVGRHRNRAALRE